jgi:DNA-binding transcriptional MerR regulator
MKDRLSIREFSAFSGLSSSTLRYGDEIGLFKPISRDSYTNYRYYSPEQIIAVNFIKVLSSLKVPLKVIKQLGDGRTPEGVADVVIRQEKILEAEWKRLHDCYSIMRMRRELITRGQQAARTGEITLVQEDEFRFVRGRRNEFKEGEGFYEPFTHFCEQAKDTRINLLFPIGALHEDWAGFAAAPGEPHYFTSIDPTGNETRKAGRYAVGYTRGYYGRFGNLAERMTRYMKQHGLTAKGPVHTIYLLDEVCVTDYDQYLSMVCVEVR